jgi:hypothetical protein
VIFSGVATSKGPAAVHVRPLVESGKLKIMAQKVTGTISRSAERHRSNSGLIEVESSSISTELKDLLKRNPKGIVAYRSNDIDVSSMAKNVLLDRGDFVEFTIVHVETTKILYFATNIRLKQCKYDREREKMMEQQIKKMLDAGAKREIGIVTVVKNREYGFIKAQDRKEDVYFRMDSFISDEGIEVEEVRFFDYYYSILLLLLLF